MEENILFEYLEMVTIRQWREKLEENEDLKKKEGVTELEEKLNETMSEGQKELFKYYGVVLSNYYNNLYYNLLAKLFRFTLKAGLEIQKANDMDKWV